MKRRKKKKKEEEEEEKNQVSVSSRTSRCWMVIPYLLQTAEKQTPSKPLTAGPRPPFIDCSCEAPRANLHSIQELFKGDIARAPSCKRDMHLYT